MHSASPPPDHAVTAAFARCSFLFMAVHHALIGSAAILALLMGTSSAATARDCYSVREGATLYAESMLQTPVATTSAAVVAWFTLLGDEPGMRVRFVDFEGDRLVGELDAYVNPADAIPVACPRAAWSRPWKQLKPLTWSDARPAGTMLFDVIEARSLNANEREGRVCFNSAFASISARVCRSLETRTEPVCLSLRRGTRLFARPSDSAKMGATSAVVHARAPVQVGKFYRATLFDRSGRTFDAYVLRTGTKTAACPEVSSARGMESIGPAEALLPNGISAGIRIGNQLSTKPRSKAQLRGNVLLCGEEDVLDGVALKLCYVASRSAH